MIRLTGNEVCNLVDFYDNVDHCEPTDLTLPHYTLHTKAGSGIGIALFVTCLVCGDERDITDYGCW